MALPIFKIGSFQFFSLDSPPQTPSEMADVIQRAGVDGTGFVKHGKKGTEFTVTSTVDLADKALAHAVAASYHAIEHAGTYDVVHQGVSYSSAGVGFVVRKVELVSIRGLKRSVGGINAGLAWLTARWTLFPIIL